MQQYHGLREMDGQRNGMETGTCIHLHIHHLRNNLFSTKIPSGGHIFLLTYFPDFVCPHILCCFLVWRWGVEESVVLVCVFVFVCQFEQIIHWNGVRRELLLCWSFCLGFWEGDAGMDEGWCIAYIYGCAYVDMI